MAQFPETRISLILRLATPGDVDAWQEFTAVYGPTLYQLARRRGLQPADAEDLAQEVLFAVARSVQRFQPDASRAKFRTWLSRIARNRLVDFIDRAIKLPLTQAASDSCFGAVHEPAADEPFDTAYRQAVFQLAAERVRQRTNRLHWQAFAETTLQQQPMAQVADALKMRLGTLYVTRCRILKLLKEEVQSIDSRLQGDDQLADGQTVSDVMAALTPSRSPQP